MNKANTATAPARYDELSYYLDLIEYERDAEGPEARLEPLQELCKKNGVKGRVGVSVRSADLMSGKISEYQKAIQESCGNINLIAQPFDVEKAVKGLVDRCVGAICTDSYIETEEHLPASKEVLKDLGKAVSDQVDGEVKIIVRYVSGKARLFFKKKNSKK